jgi:adenylosuccinate lyase
MTQHRKEIKSFIKNIINGEYKNAHGNLAAVVEDKMKQKIKKASKQRLF